MFQSLDVFRTAMAMAQHAGQRQALSAQNIANADTPGYAARRLNSFAETLHAQPSQLRATRVGHLFGHTVQQADIQQQRTGMDPNGNSVSLELEMVEAVGAKRQHDRALAIYRHGLSVLRSSLGRA